MKIKALLLLLAAVLAGCNHIEAGDGMSRELAIAGFTVTVPADAVVSRTLRPHLEMDAGISPSPTWRSRRVHADSVVIRMPDRRGSLVFFDPDTESHAPKTPCMCAEVQPLVRGCPRNGLYNGIEATEMLSEGPRGHYHKIVHYGRCGLHAPAALVGRYDDASWTTRQIFDDILVSVRR
jgi:hypothetical protein